MPPQDPQQTDWDPRALADLRGRVYLITGSNRGLGFFAAEQLARAGARVIMTGRNPNRLTAARAAIERRLTDAGLHADLETLLLDVGNLGSMRAAAATVRVRKKLDGLLLNAGIVHAPRHRQLDEEAPRAPAGAVDEQASTRSTGREGLQGDGA